MAIEELRSESRAEHEYEVVFGEARRQNTDVAKRAEVRRQVATMVADGTLRLTDIQNEDPFFATLAREALLNWEQGRAIAEANPYADVRVKLKNVGPDLIVKLLKKRVTHVIGQGHVGGERSGRGVPNREAVLGTWKSGAVETMGLEAALHYLWRHGKEVRTWLPDDRRKSRTIVEVGMVRDSGIEEEPAGARKRAATG